jgi:hypothetical protein
VVPPFWVAQPTRPVCGCPGGVVGGGVVGGGVVGGGVEGGGVAGGLVGGVVPEPSTRTSSKRAPAYAVTSAIRPDPYAELVPEPTWVPLTNPRTVLPPASIRSVYQVPVETVRDALPSTVIELPLTT